MVFISNVQDLLAKKIDYRTCGLANQITRMELSEANAYYRKK